jgi:hypothetical protein
MSVTFRHGGLTRPSGLRKTENNSVRMADGASETEISYILCMYTALQLRHTARSIRRADLGH